MVVVSTKSVRIDLNQFKLHLNLKPEVELTLHFDSPSRRFYLSVIALIVHEMKKNERITSIPLEKHLEVLALLNQTVGGKAGSSKKQHLLPRIYRKWKDALPDLENAPLFKVIGKKKSYDNSIDRVYVFSEGEKDSWANLFEYKGSHENVRLRFSIDRLSKSLDDVTMVYGEYPQLMGVGAWERFIADLKAKSEDRSKSEYDSRQLKPLEPPLNQTKRGLGTGPRRWQLASVCVLFSLIMAATALFVWKDRLFAPKFEVASIEKMAFQLPDKPSIAVLPFSNLSDDPKQDYFSDGLTEDIITALSKIGNMFVIARNTTFTYKGNPVKVKQVAEDLGVRYVLEGSVRKAEDQLRITAQLIDALNGHHLWAERYDRDLKDIFAIQDDITKKIITALNVKLTGEHLSYASAKGTDNLEAYLKILQAESLSQHSDLKESNALRRQLAEEAIALDPNYAWAYDQLGWSHLHDIYYGMTKDFAKSWKTAFELGQKAQSLDEKTARDLLGSLYLLNGEYDKGVAEGERMVEFFPNAALAQFQLGRFLMAADRVEEAIPLYKKALRLDPYAIAPYYYNLGAAYWMIGQNEEAISICKKGFQRFPDDLFTHMVLAVSFIEAGNVEEARKSAAEILRVHPKASLDWFAKIIHWKNKDIVNRCIDNLRKAGLT